MQHNIAIKRVYSAAEEADGYRILVDRLWPRGISKVNAKLDLWEKEISPSSELRRWFAHKEELFSQFSDKYILELNENEYSQKFADKIAELAKEKPVTLLYSAHDEEHNNAVVLKKWLSEKLKNKKSL